MGAVERNTHQLIMDQVGLKKVVISPKKRILLTTIQKEKRTISLLEKKILQQQEVINSLQCSTSSSISSLIKSVESPALQEIIQIEHSNSKKKPQGHRFTMEQKILSLSLAKHGNYSYQHLRDFVSSLPSKRTNNRLLAKMQIMPGTNEDVMAAIKCQKLNVADKNVLFVLDETKLKKRLIFTSGSPNVT
ncbi:hypothetical protein PV326_013985, partial [Microctonus aethiopoides]